MIMETYKRSKWYTTTIGSPETRGFILVPLARVNASNKPIALIYMRECHENKTTRFQGPRSVI